MSFLSGDNGRRGDVLIGIAGRKGHGKDTVAALLAERGYKVLKFADPLKDMLRAFYRAHAVDDATIERKIEGDLKETPCRFLRDKTPRHAMQTLGTEWGRVCIADDLWVRSLIDRAYIHGGKVGVAVPDMRFTNECEAIRAAGGFSIHINASARVPQNEFSDHPSETGIAALPVDMEISNNAGTFELKFAVDEAVKNLSSMS